MCVVLLLLTIQPPSLVELAVTVLSLPVGAAMGGHRVRVRLAVDLELGGSE